MLTRPRRHRRVARRALGAVVNVFSNRSVFTRARLLRGGPPLPTPKELQCQEARQNAPPTVVCASSWYAATRRRRRSVFGCPAGGLTSPRLRGEGAERTRTRP